MPPTRRIAMKRIIVLVGAMLAFATPGHATWIMRGVGSDSCEKFLSAEAGLPPGQTLRTTIQGHQYVGATEIYAEWVDGFLTAALSGQENKQIAADSAGVDLWLRKWCDAHPANNLLDAVVAFVRDQTGK
jgi:hypothetical protein